MNWLYTIKLALCQEKKSSTSDLASNNNITHWIKYKSYECIYCISRRSEPLSFLIASCLQQPPFWEAKSIFTWYRGKRVPSRTQPPSPLWLREFPGNSSKWRRFDPVTAEATSPCGSRPVAVRGPLGRWSRWRRQVFSLCVLRSRALLCRGSEGVRFRSWPEGQAGPENLRSNAEPMWKPRGLALS